jgi:hypothetical protein
MDLLAETLGDAGGAAAPRERCGQLRTLLASELQRGAQELARKRSGYPEAVTVAITADAGRLLAVAPVSPALRADPAAASERGWLLVAALVGALVEAGALPQPAAGAALGGLLLSLPAPGADHELAALAVLAFEDQVRPVDRLRARALAVPADALPQEDAPRAPIGATHQLLVAAQVAALGGRPADPSAAEEHEDAVLSTLLAGLDAGPARPHEDPDPGRRVARRILQRLDGMGKWGGYHTEFAHLSRGFAGNDRSRAEEVGERLIAAGLLMEKPSVGQRHVYLNPRRAREIRELIQDARVPTGLELGAG